MMGMVVRVVGMVKVWQGYRIVYHGQRSAHDRKKKDGNETRNKYARVTVVEVVKVVVVVVVVIVIVVVETMLRNGC